MPRRGLESWLGLMHEVGLLRLPLAFARTHAEISLSENGAVATRGRTDYSWQIAGSTTVMRAGCHYAQFTLVDPGVSEDADEEGDVMVGVIRPGWKNDEIHDDVVEVVAYGVEGHCFYHTCRGYCYPGTCEWEGRTSANTPGDRIGLLLDLDQGSMSVWKNDAKLGVMKVGLSGEYCWAVSMFFEGSNVWINAAPAPASPTQEELAAATTWLDAH